MVEAGGDSVPLGAAELTMVKDILLENEPSPHIKFRAFPACIAIQKVVVVTRQRRSAENGANGLCAQPIDIAVAIGYAKASAQLICLRGKSLVPSTR